MQSTIPSHPLSISQTDSVQNEEGLKHRLRQSHQSVFHLWKMPCHTSAAAETLLSLTQLMQ